MMFFANFRLITVFNVPMISVISSLYWTQTRRNRRPSGPSSVMCIQHRSAPYSLNYVHILGRFQSNII